ncbi:MFS transporter [Roseomonas xinghualingensis]|uniref:MFS transporter n=1 Tax=Roseomonas xinghualingensis TaxID=2986475 RepID=UPI0021F200A2|nr:MFS transporter [Roseomonas sp. SXEYE001]MCV4207879.1 MFS transporter [Roseomonas sp. SXEYE001]
MVQEDAPGSAIPNRDWRIIGLIGTNHFLSHFYLLCLAPLFPIWREEFGVSYAVLGLSVALMSAVTALLQTPVGFLVDRHGARPFLIGGSLLMALSIAAMSFAPNFWVILVLAVFSGIGNSVIHPADYAILGSSIDGRRMGRAFAMHTFTGNLGFMAAPLAIGLMTQTLGIGWRPALLVAGLFGVPVVAAILLQSRILQDQAKPKDRGAPVGRQVLLSRTMLMFFTFFLLSSMATSGIQSFLIATLDSLWSTPLAVGSLALTGYVAGATGGVLIGGWYADRYSRHFTFIAALTAVSIILFLAMGLMPLPDGLLPVVALAAGTALGASRTPRDVMVKNAAPPGQMGKVFGFISSGLPLGGAITPVPFGLMLDHGLPWLVLPTVALLLLGSLLCVGSARAEALRSAGKPSPSAVPAE